MLYTVLLLLACASLGLPQAIPQGADMPLDLPPQFDTFGPGLDMGGPPGGPPGKQPPLIDIPLGPTDPAIGGTGGGPPIIDPAGPVIGTGGGPPLIDPAGPVIGTHGKPPVMIDVPHGLGPPGTGGHVKPSECRSLIDLMILIDSSDSINAPDFDKLRYAIAHIIPDLDLGPRRIRIGWVVFSTTVAEVQHLSFDKKALIKAAETIIHQREGTMTNLAIEEMIAEFDRNGRPGVPKVAMTISDGISKLRGETLRQAKLARDSGIEMFAIGVGLRDNTELFGIASSKDKVVSLADFDSLRRELKKLTKVICPCPKIRKLGHGIKVEPGPRSIGSVRQLSCKHGLQPVGNPTLTCLKDSTWSLLEFSCEACPNPMPEYGNATLMTKGPYFLGDVVEYICYDGYVIPVPIRSTCEPGPTGPYWTDPVGHCSACQPPPEYPDMTLDQSGKLTVGSLRHYTCHKGLVQTGPIEIACISIDGIPSWNKPLHSCTGCHPPPQKIGWAKLQDPPQTGGMPKMKGGGAFIGEERYYKCMKGYVETGMIKIICLADQGVARWSIPDHSCTACLNEPPDILNAELIKPGGTLIGDRRIYKCVHGYMSLGPVETICEVAKGHVGWRVPTHACVACDVPPQIPNAILDIQSVKDTRIGTVKKYVCQKGFIQTGPITVGCVEGPAGPEWVPPDHICTMCEAPPKLKNAMLDLEYGDNTVGSIRRYTCDQGYLPIGPGKITVECFGEMKGENGIAFWGPPSDICSGCIDTPILQHAELVGGSNLVGGTMKYKCLDKYHSIGPVEIKCLPSGTWSDPEFTCSACHEPERVPNAKLEPGRTIIGTTRYYKCKKGFINVGDVDITCLPDATWSMRKFDCFRCLEPPIYENAVLEPGSIDVYAVRRYTCMRGYLATGPITTTCSPSKEKMGKPGWSKPVHHCKDCGEPYIVKNADLIPGPRTIGSLQRYQCRKGFVPSRPPHSMCQPNAEWYPPEFKCIACTGAPEIHRALPVGRLDVTTLIGESRTYVCEKGYVQTGTITAVCNGDLTWTISKTRCKGCETPYPIDFGSPIDPLTNTVGSVMAYQCLTGYEAVGKPEVYCMKTGEWSFPEFKCVIGCYNVPIYDNIIVVSQTGHLHKDTITFACGSGFLLRGNPIITCTDKGVWSEAKFTCEACVGAPTIPLALPVGPLDVVTLIGEARTYVCEKDYVQTGTVTAVCNPDLTWTLSNTRCKGCENPHPIDFGSPIDPLTNTVGSVMAYQCLTGYEAVGKPEVYCMKTGEWSLPEFKCVIGCYNVPIYDNIIVASQTGHLHKDTITFACGPGYLLRGNPTITCTDKGVWSDAKFTCEACVGAPAIPLALPVGPLDVITLIGEARTYVCEKDYVQTGTVTAVCNPDLTWTLSNTRCKGCENPHPIDFGSPIDPLTNTVGSVMAYQCLTGYEAVGKPEVYCMKTGEWSLPEFKCVIGCYNVPIYDNIIVASQTGHLHKDTITFACGPGYLLRGNPTITCTDKGVWSEAKFTCEACVGAPAIPLALPVGPLDVITLIGEARTYVCEKDYVQTGTVTAVCNPDLTWTLSNTRCKGCENPHPIDFGSPIDPLTNTVGSVMAYQCLTGYEAVGKPEVYCMKTGEWSLPEFKCVIGCYNVPIYDNIIVASQTGHLHKDTITFACGPGYLLRGNPTITCTDKGVWSEAKFTCEACVGAPAIPLALPVGPLDVITLIGEARTYVCEKDYVQTGTVTAVCNPDLTWTLSNTRCKGCENPHPIDFGSPIDPLTNTVGSVMAYQCLTGYEAVGKPEVYCMKTGEWSLPEFKCVIGCNNVPIYDNVIVASQTGQLHKDTITFACGPGYLLRGNPTITCTDKGVWSDAKFTCEACVGAPTIPLALPVGPLDVVTLIGEARTYVCEKDYVQTGTVTAVCNPDLTWTLSNTRCKGCENPYPIDFGSPIDPLTNTVGSVMAYQCLTGYEAVGKPEVYCMKTGEWSLPEFKCVIGCYNVPIYDNIIVASQTGHLHKDTITFACGPGYLLRGNPTITCTDKGVWSEAKFTCEACVGAPAIPLALPVGPLDVITLIGEARTYVCEKDYVQTGTVTAVCNPDLTWTISNTRCKGCENPHPIDFGSPTDPLTNTVGSVMAYQCLTGYEAVGKPEVYCMKTGEWSLPEFKCVIGCYKVPVYENTIVEVQTGQLHKDTITFACVPGYLLRGNPTITCTHNGLWSKKKFTCEACFGAPDLPWAIPIGPIKVFTLIGETRSYRCENGFVQTGAVMVTCLNDLTWSAAAERCRGCEFEPPVTNGMPLKPKSNMIGAKMSYRCLSGYAPTGPAVVHCMENGEWSAPTFHCVISCNKPPVFKDAVVETVSGHHLKSVATYRCLQRGARSGNPHLFCLANGHWSERKFICGKCAPPPHLDTAIPKTMGPTEVGSRIEYICMDGFLAKVPIISECLPSLEWSVPAEQCYDCGKPPEIYNTYCSMGSSTIGSKRKYECNYGYHMIGTGVITCLPSGQWSKPRFSCQQITTTTTTTPAPVPHNPSVCDRCRMLNNVGFMNHPTDCTQFVQCYYGSSGGIVAVYQQCPFGLYWSQQYLTCIPAKDVDCPVEKCLNRRIRSYKHSDSARCSAYWECVNGKSVARCCTDGYSYVANKGCEPDPTCSIKQCPYEDMYPGCDKRPNQDMTLYEQHVGAGYWVPMPCAPSTAFSMLDCQCSQHTWVDPGFDCRPELHLDFDDGTITDRSGNHLPIFSEGVIPYGGAAYFNGNARLLINRFSNMAFGGHLVIKFRYKEDLRGSTAGSLQALVTNGDCGEDPSIIVAKMMGYVLLGSKTSSTRTFAMPVVDTEWKQVTYFHDEEQLEGRVCGASYSRYSYGPIRATHCGVQIGNGRKMANFMGLIDDLAIYTCRPPRDVLYHYAYTIDT